MKKIVVIIVSLLLTACVSIYQPVPEGYVGETSRINDSYSNLNLLRTKAHFFILFRVDDKLVLDSYTETLWKFNKDIRTTGKYTASAHVVAGSFTLTPNFYPVITSRDVLPSEQKFSIQCFVFYPTEKQRVFNDSMRVSHEFMFTPKPGENYTIKGKLEKSGSTIWLEDSAGRVIEGSVGKES